MPLFLCKREFGLLCVAVKKLYAFKLYELRKDVLFSAGLWTVGTIKKFYQNRFVGHI